MVRHLPTRSSNLWRVLAQEAGSFAAADAEAVVEIVVGMATDPSVAPLAGAAGKEAALEGAARIVDPFVEVADHVVDRVLAPFAAAARGRAGLAEQRPRVALGEVQAGIEVVLRSISVKD